LGSNLAREVHLDGAGAGHASDGGEGGN
jgi:hypothetical protein